jgi:hypothetical protein
MQFENTTVMNFEGALRGMRAPMNSWAKSDSEFGIWCEHENDETIYEVSNKWAEYELQNATFATEEDYDKEFDRIASERYDWLWQQGTALIGIDHHYTLDLIGPKDMDLCRRLISGGSEHRKFLRQIFVSVDITAPLYWWKEFDTYKVGTTANSTSTMHKLASTPITLDCFEIDDFDKQALIEVQAEDVPNHIVYDFIEWLEACRQNYNETKDKRYWKELIRWLPNGWLQTRTVTMNYENLRSMYHQREHHKLVEWHAFCDWVKTLPYAQELIID